MCSPLWGGGLSSMFVDVAFNLRGKDMSKIRISDLKPFDIAEHLGDEKAIVEYLNLALEDHDPLMLALALGDVASALG